MVSSNANTLIGLLQSVFGFAGFRANQEVVCTAAIEGHDLLLVMPTGAGKSLCYQLPAIARGGTALVISPLISLMEDQAAKLAALGLRVARITPASTAVRLARRASNTWKAACSFCSLRPSGCACPDFPRCLQRANFR